MSRTSELEGLIRSNASDATLGRWLRENCFAVLEAVELDECTVSPPYLGAANANEPELPL